MPSIGLAAVTRIAGASSSSRKGAFFREWMLTGFPGIACARLSGGSTP